MSHQSRVNPAIELPADMEPQLRRALTEVLQKHVSQINHFALDSTAISSTQVIAADLVLVDATAATVVCTLVPAIDWVDKLITVKKMSANTNTVLITGQAGETIDEQATVTISVQYRTLSVQSDGANWFIV